MSSEASCAKCGFLALRRRREFDLVGADSYFRESDLLATSDQGAAYPWFDSWPVCFVNAKNLKAEITPIPRPGLDADNRRRHEVVTQLRECESFEPWLQGSTPKEHQEMIALREQREWQAKETKRLEARDDRRKRLDRIHQFSSLFIAVLGLLLAVWAATRDKPPQPAPIVNIQPKIEVQPAPVTVVQPPALPAPPNRSAP